VAIAETVSARSTHTGNAMSSPWSPPAPRSQTGRTNRDRMAWRSERGYELKLRDFTLKSLPTRRPTSHAVRSAALSIAALGCTARA
jgi:hypothetical protein